MVKRNYDELRIDKSCNMHIKKKQKMCKPYNPFDLTMKGLERYINAKRKLIMNEKRGLFFNTSFQ